MKTPAVDRTPESKLRAPKDPRALLVFFLIAGLVLTADLTLKYLAFTHVAGSKVELTRQNAGLAQTIPKHDPIVLVPYVLSLKLTTNIGAVFGLGKGAQLLFIAVSVLAVVFILYSFWRSRAGAILLHVALSLVLAGALGNLYDRLRYNAVRDMLWLLPETRIWPWIFNVADAALMVGVGFLLVTTWWAEPSRRRSTTEH